MKYNNCFINIYIYENVVYDRNIQITELNMVLKSLMIRIVWFLESTWFIVEKYVSNSHISNSDNACLIVISLAALVFKSLQNIYVLEFLLTIVVLFYL